MKLEVKKNTKRNIVFGSINKIVLMILPFIMKSVINITLGAEYLGLNSLFTSILTVLSLSELGISSALVYHMYKPIAENDQGKINALLSFYRKAYQIIGLIVLVIGLLVIPFMPVLINGSYPEDINIYIIYIIQLINSVISYFMFGYKQSLLVAYQREDINSILYFISNFGMQLFQIVLLLTTKSYYLYTIVLPIFTLLNNALIGIFTKRMFPEAHCYGVLDKETLASIKKLVAGTFIQKVCAITRNSLDSICLSAFIGLTVAGIYNNYYGIMSGIATFLGVIGTSLTGGIGNHVALRNKDENFNELKFLDYFYMLISSWCTVMLFCLYQPFMRIWMGDNMMLDIKIVALICLYFYLLRMGDMRSIYSNACGLWWEQRYRSIVESILNILLNIILGKYFGIAGIVIATIISLFACNFIWASCIEFNLYFGIKKIVQYYLYHLRYSLSCLVTCLICYFLSTNIQGTGILGLIIIAVICSLTSVALLLILNFNKDMLRRGLKIMKRE